MFPRPPPRPSQWPPWQMRSPPPFLRPRVVNRLPPVRIPVAPRLVSQEGHDRTDINYRCRICGVKSHVVNKYGAIHDWPDCPMIEFEITLEDKKRLVPSFGVGRLTGERLVPGIFVIQPLQLNNAAANVKQESYVMSQVVPQEIRARAVNSDIVVEFVAYCKEINYESVWVVGSCGGVSRGSYDFVDLIGDSGRIYPSGGPVRRSPPPVSPAGHAWMAGVPRTPPPTVGGPRTPPPFTPTPTVGDPRTPPPRTPMPTVGGPLGSAVPPSAAAVAGPCVYLPLENPGTSCYANSVVQVFIRARGFCEALERVQEQEYYPVVQELLRLRRAHLRPGAPTDSAARLVQAVDQRFCDGRQQDVHEFLSELLAQLPGDVRRLFQFAQKKTYTCRNCLFRSWNTEKEWNTIILTPPRNVGSSFAAVVDDVKFFTMKTCKYCLSDQEHDLVETRVFGSPDAGGGGRSQYVVVFVQLFENMARRNGLTLTGFDADDGYVFGAEKYRLVGVIRHQGATVLRGHYSAVVRSATRVGWDEISDQQCCPLSSFVSDLDRVYLMLFEREADVAVDPLLVAAPPRRSYADAAASWSAAPAAAASGAAARAAAPAASDQTRFRCPTGEIADVPIDYSLPVAEHADRIRAMLRSRRTPFCVLTADTGSGKTSQVPILAVYDRYEARRRVLLTQPRILATRAVAGRLREQLLGRGVPVSLHTSLDAEHRRDAQIAVMTDGILRRRLHDRAFLRGVRVIIIDEAHERSANVDVCLALLRRRRSLLVRMDIKVVVMSATIDAQEMRDWLGAEWLHIEGRQFKTDIVYKEVTERFQGFDRVDSHPLRRFLSRDVNPKALENVSQQPDGAVEWAIYLHVEFELNPSSIDEAVCGSDILIFVDGERTINEYARELENRFAHLGVALDIPTPLIIKLSGQSPDDVVRLALSKQSSRKVIVSTNIASTSVTIDGLYVVIDTGKVRRAKFDRSTTLTVLDLDNISRAEADQRAGRVGRQQPGRVIRLYSQVDHQKSKENVVPELQTGDLRGLVCEFLARNVDFRAVSFLSPPAEYQYKLAEDSLAAQGAIDCNGDLTDIGRLVDRLPLDPNLALTVANAAARCELLELALHAAAILSQEGRLFLNVSDEPVSTEEFAAKSDGPSRLYSWSKPIRGSLISHVSVLQNFICCPVDEQAKWVIEKHLNVRLLRRAQAVYFDLRARVLSFYRLDGEALDWDVDTSTAEGVESVCKVFLRGFLYTAAERVSLDVKGYSPYTFLANGQGARICNRTDERPKVLGDCVVAAAAFASRDPSLTRLCPVNRSWLQECVRETLGDEGLDTIFGGRLKPSPAKEGK